MLDTPLGKIEILVDNKITAYSAVPCALNENCPDLDGLYKISIEFSPDGKNHEIWCRIKGHKGSSDDDIAPGENLELKSFFKGFVKLSIGTEGNSGYLPDGTRVSTYDYDTEYYTDGIKHVIFPDTKTKHWAFVIAWIKNANEKNENQPWLGVDTTLFPSLKKY